MPVSSERAAVIGSHPAWSLSATPATTAEPRLASAYRAALRLSARRRRRAIKLDVESGLALEPCPGTPIATTMFGHPVRHLAPMAVVRGPR